MISKTVINTPSIQFFVSDEFNHIEILETNGHFFYFTIRFIKF